MELPVISSTSDFIVLTALIFAVVIGRYALIAGVFYVIFYVWFPDRWKQRKIATKDYKKHQFRKEFFWSSLTAVLFALAGSVLYLLWQNGYTKIYVQLDTYPIWWLPLSLIVAMLVHETYYYWLHRWMHLPRIFPIFHKVHHNSHITSPWTAFSFHPLEGILQAVFLPLLLMVFPMHPYVIITQLTIMTFSSVINHLDIEIYPANFHRHFFGKWLIGATHHSLHHKQFKYNFGLYFTFWDMWKKTDSPLFDKLFRDKTENKEEKNS